MAHDEESWHAYRLGGIAIASARRLAALEPFPGESGAPQLRLGELSQSLSSEPGEVRETHGFLAGRERRVRATWRGDALVDLECDGELVRWREQALDVAGQSDLAFELLLGPGLLLALLDAHRLTLHASAVRAGDRALVLAGESGRGKSTLAAGFGDDALADDLALIDLDTLELTPRFPQRKWPESRQARLPERAGVVTLIELRGDPRWQSPRLERLPTAAATYCWLGHAVPARLLSAAWSRRLLGVAAAAAEATEAYRLHLPWRPDAVQDQTTQAVDLLRRSFRAPTSP